MNNNESRYKLLLALLFGAFIFVLVAVAVRVAFYRPPSNVVLIIAGLAGIVLNAVAWVLASQKAREYGWRIARLKLTFVAYSIASATGIAYGCGEPGLSPYLFYIAIGLFVVSRFLDRPGKTEGKGIKN